MLVNDDLFDFFKANDWLISHGYTLTELENMTPFERSVYVKLVITKMKEKANEG